MIPEHVLKRITKAQLRTLTAMVKAQGDKPTFTAADMDMSTKSLSRDFASLKSMGLSELVERGTGGKTLTRRAVTDLGREVVENVSPEDILWRAKNKMDAMPESPPPWPAHLSNAFNEHRK